MNLLGVRWLADRVARSREYALRLTGAQRAGLALGLLTSACNLDNPGVAATESAVAFPVALALSEEDPPATLFVANANFDLSYNAGSVQSYDLNKIASLIDKETNPCRPVLAESPDAGDQDAGAPDGAVEDAGGADAEPIDAGSPDADSDAEASDADLTGDASDAGEPDDAEPDAAPDTSVTEVMVPSRQAEAEDLGQVVRTNLCDNHRRADGTVSRSDDESICCFGGSETIRALQKSHLSVDSFASAIALSDDGAHLYVPIRSKTKLLYFDVQNDGELTCGGTGSTSSCDSGPKLGDRGDLTKSGVRDRDGFAAQPTSVVTGRGDALGYEHDFVATSHETGALSLFRIEPGSGEPRLVDVLEGGSPRAVSLSFDVEQKLFYVASASRNTVERVGVRVRAGDGVPLLYGTSAVAINGLASAFDVRDAQVDSRKQPQPIPVLRTYAIVRGSGQTQTQALLFLEQDSVDGRFARVVDEVRLGSGPTKMLQAEFGGRHLLFVSCYAEGSVVVVDADRRQIVAQIKEFSGPFDMKIDPKRGLLYVTDFRASVVRVADIRYLENPDLPEPRIVATLGKPYFAGSIQ